MNIAELFVRIRADASDLQRATSDAVGSLEQMGSRMQSIGGRISSIGQSMTVGLSLPLAAIGAAGLKSAMDLESFAASLNVLIGDTERANAVFDELYEFSAKSPFNWKDLSDGTRMLAAFGIEAEEIVPTLRRIGDIASGTGNNIAELAELYGKAQVQGRLMAEDINQLTGRGIPIIAALAEQFGVAESEVRELVSSGSVGFEHLEAAFVSLTDEGGKFYNMTAVMSETSAGKMATLKDSFEQVADIVGTALLPTFNRFVEVVQRATEWFTGLDEETQSTIVTIGALVAVVGPTILILGKLLTAAGAIAAAFGTTIPLAFGAVMPFLGPVGLIAAGAVAIAVVWRKWGDDITAIVSRVWDAVSGWFKSVTKVLGKILGPVAQVATDWIELWGAILSFLVDFARVAAGKFAEITGAAFEWLRDRLSPITNAVTGILQPIIDFFGRMKENIGRIVREMVDAIWSVFTGGLQRVADGVSQKLNTVTGFFERMSDVLVGNSIVPDMVTLIKAEFDDMSEHMILKTVEATARTTEEFAKIEVSFTDTMNRTLGAVQDAVREWSDLLPADIGKVVDQVSGVWAKIHTALTLKDTLEETWRDWVTFATRFVGAVNDMWKKVGFVLGTLAEIFSGPKIGLNTGYQQGGGVPLHAPPGSQPAYSMAPSTPSFAMVAAPEAVGGDGAVIHIGPINIAGNVIGTTVDALAEALAEPISRALGHEAITTRQQDGSAFAP